jgi:ferredoxin-NADP reductase
VFGLVLTHRVITPLRNASRHRLRVAAVQPEGPGVVSIVIEGRNLHELGAESGQFFRWRFLAPDLWLTAHPFSLSAPPTSTHLRLEVKTLGDRRASLCI